jgi:hypothetical protein
MHDVCDCLTFRLFPTFLGVEQGKENQGGDESKVGRSKFVTWIEELMRLDS